MDKGKYTDQEIKDALDNIETIDHFTMCKYWRFAPLGTRIYFDTSLPTAVKFKDRLFDHFGGFTSEISKMLGHYKKDHRANTTG